MTPEIRCFQQIYKGETTKLEMELNILVLLAIAAGVWAEVVRYDNYKVYRLLPQTEEQLRHLKYIENQGLGFDFWKSARLKNEPVDVMVPPHKFDHFEEIMQKLNINYDLHIANVQELIDEVSSKPVPGAHGLGMDWYNYYNLDAIYAWLEKMASKHNEVSIVVAGKSYEGRDIKGVKLSFKEGNKAVFLEGGIHAREWVGVATVTYILQQFLTNPDPHVKKIVSSYDWYMFPVVNPDGYEYTFKTDRLWRKTRKPNGKCVGADPNRNWGFHWGEDGVSHNPCDEDFAGTGPFSEPETKSLSEFITSIKDKLVGYIAFHNFSQYLLIPYGHTKKHLDNYDELMEIGKKAVSSLSERFGTIYRLGSIADIIYKTSGASIDWVKGTYKTPITYVYELRDTGHYGFLLPTSQILPTGQETFDSFMTLMTEAKARGH